MSDQDHDAEKRNWSPCDTLAAFLQIQAIRAESMEGFFDQVFSRYD
jgi:hypothetical protein